MKQIFFLLRLCIAAIFAIFGAALTIQIIAILIDTPHFSAYKLGHITGRLIAVLLAFTIAWEFIKKRK
jgi:hypothetical protein